MTKPQRVESRVRVGVRIRPLTSTEITQGGEDSLKVTSPSIKIGQRQFTYDSVFNSNIGQQELYDTVSAPLLKSFTEGYNATVSDTSQSVRPVNELPWLLQTLPFCFCFLLDYGLWTDRQW